MRTLKTSVRRLVEFLLRSGDINAGSGRRGDVEAMQAGSHIHRMLQASAGNAYQAEVPLSCSVYFPEASFSPHAARLDIPKESVSSQEGFFLTIEGRADGIVDDDTSPLIVDEIKGVARDVATIEEPDPLHEAQALCYAYLYVRRKLGPAVISTAFNKEVVVRLTYASMTTGEVRQLERTYVAPDIEAWFFLLLTKAQRWAAWRTNHDELRQRSLSTLTFPFATRVGQRELMDAVTSAIHAGKRLYAQAPTGSGKTIATLYPTLSAMGSGKASRVFFLTAKTMTRRAALECLRLLGRQGIATTTLVVTARNKICPLRSSTRGADVRMRPLSSLCNPVECPLARNHYDAVNDALYELITTFDVFDADVIEQVAKRYHVCPYELQRDAARWSDVVVCDYHFAFAPSASLLGLVDEAGGNATVFLVDEAHNLPERMRSMYSATLDVASLKGLERLLQPQSTFTPLAAAVRRTVFSFPAWDKTLATGTQPGPTARGRRPAYQLVHLSDEFVNSLTALAAELDDSLRKLSSPTGGFHEVQGQGGISASMVEVFLALQDMCREVRAFLAALQRAEVGYVTYVCQGQSGGRRLSVLCVDPSHDLNERLEQAKAAVFFSGTLLPMDYHRKLLAAADDDRSIDVASSFDPRLQQVLIGTDVSARYSRRGPELYDRVAAYIVTLTRERPGNYLVFLPSYAMINEVETTLKRAVGDKTLVIRQHPNMREEEREHFVDRFREPHATGTSLIGLAVLGGIFGESIDLPHKMLVGVVVVGTGMPAVSCEREVTRNYFDAKGGRGFAYAYTYPGMIKVLQAAGRLIRTEEDWGTVLLLDDRFLEAELQKAFPKEWHYPQTCTLASLPGILGRQ